MVSGSSGISASGEAGHPLAQRRQEPRRLENLWDQALVEQDRVGDQAHRHAVVGQVRDVDLDRIAGPELALLDDPQVGARARRAREPPDEPGVAHPQPELEARQPRLYDLEQCGPDAPALPQERLRDREALGRQVLAERSGPELAAELGLPARGLLGAVRVDRLVRPAVHAAVGLVVAVDVHPAHGDASLDGRLPDRGRDGALSGADRSGPPDVDTQDARHGKAQASATARAPAASRMSCAVSAGCETPTTCEAPAISTTRWASARSAMMRCAPTGMLWSSSPKMNQ